MVAAGGSATLQTNVVAGARFGTYLRRFQGNAVRLASRIVLCILGRTGLDGNERIS